MFKKLFDIATVWVVTLFANFGTDYLQLLPIIRELLTIFSIIIAIAYTLYRFSKDWTGFLPWKRMKEDIRQNTADIKANTKDISDLNKK